MRKILLLFFLAGAIYSSHAQEQPKRRQLEDLKLNTQQSRQIQDINRDYLNDSRDIRNNRSLSGEERTTRLDALNTTRTDKIRALLDAEQYAKWQRNRGVTLANTQGRAEQREERKTKDEAVKALGLTEAQGQELRSINKDYLAKAADIRNNTNITKEERGKQLKTLNEERLRKIKTAIGEAQFNRYNNWRMRNRMEERSMRNRQEGRKER